MSVDSVEAVASDFVGFSPARCILKEMVWVWDGVGVFWAASPKVHYSFLEHHGGSAESCAIKIHKWLLELVFYWLLCFVACVDRLLVLV